MTLRIIHTRLTDVACLPDHELILECYHPCDKISTPYLHCDYLGTDGLSGYSEDSDAQPAFGQLHELYSRFRPVVQEQNRRGRARYPVAGSSSAQAQADDDLTASISVQLDEDELFSQLCAVTNLVKTGPRRGLFLSHVNLDDRVVRVFRGWLAARAAAGDDGAEEEDDAILWTDRSKTVGLKFRVTKNADDGARPAILTREEEENLPVSYNLVYEELRVRASALLLEVEKSEAQEVASTGKAIVIASF